MSEFNIYNSICDHEIQFIVSIVSKRLLPLCVGDYAQLESIQAASQGKGWGLGGLTGPLMLQADSCRHGDSAVEIIWGRYAKTPRSLGPGPGHHVFFFQKKSLTETY